MATLPDTDFGVICLSLKDLETEGMPMILSMRDKVQRGERLSDADIDYLERVIHVAETYGWGRLLQHHPEFTKVAFEVFSSYGQIIDRALENEKHGDSDGALDMIDAPGGGV
jgi:hypothetical protein